MGDGGTQWDAPNQQVVRDDASPPWQEGSGGGTEEPVSNGEPEATLDTMTKAQLLEHAQGLGLDVDESMTKADIKAEIEQA